MPHETEAACLLRTGSLFNRRVGLASSHRELVFAGVKHGAFSIYVGDGPFFHFDLDGRWQRVLIDETHSVKALDAQTVAFDRVREGPNLVMHRRSLGFVEATDLDARIRDQALALLEDLHAQRVKPVGPPDGSAVLSVDELSDLLDRVLRWDANAWFHQRELHRAAYGPMGWLPPDAHQAIVLQETNTQNSQPRNLTEFEPHVRAVAKLYGRRALQCRSVFLECRSGVRDAIDHFAGLLEIIARFFPIETSPAPARLSERDETAFQLHSIETALASNEFPRIDAAGWKELAARHLGRVYVRLSGEQSFESAHAPSTAMIPSLIGNLKAAGLGVVLVVEKAAALAPGEETAIAEMIRSATLTRGDRVYLESKNTSGEDDRIRTILAPWLAQTGVKLIARNPAKMQMAAGGVTS